MMTPANPPITNIVFTAPEDMDVSQVHSISAYKGTVPPGNNLDGQEFIVVAWKPSPEDLKLLILGGTVFLSCLGTSLPPHFITADFREASYQI